MSRINDPGSESASATSQIKDKAAELQQNIRDIGGQVRDAARTQYDTARESAGQYIEQGRAKAREWEDEVETYVHEKPLQALLIAAGVGLLLGVLWRRS